MSSICLIHLYWAEVCLVIALASLLDKLEVKLYPPSSKLLLLWRPPKNAAVLPVASLSLSLMVEVGKIYEFISSVRRILGLLRVFE